MRSGPRLAKADGCPAVQAAPPANPSANPQQCFVWYDRHIAKNGGSTLAVLMQRLEEQRECLYYGYHLTPGPLNQIMRGLHALNDTATSSHPKLCVDAHAGHSITGSGLLEQLGNWRHQLKVRGVDCKLMRTLRVRDPLSYYLSFYLWQPGAKPRRDPQRLGAEGFLRWANATPNLQASTLLRVASTDYAANMPEVRCLSKQGKVKTAEDCSRSNPLISSDMIDLPWKRVGDVLRHIDLAVPLERFDESLLLIADALGLKHIQYARIDPECDRGRPQRVALDDEAQCSDFSRRVTHCGGRRKACAPEHVTACEEVIRRVAPLDRRLYDSVRSKFEGQLTLLGKPFAERVRAFKKNTVGVFAGGAPTRPQCRFRRIANASIPIFETDPCMRAPQAIGAAVWRERSFAHQAVIEPV